MKTPSFDATAGVIKPVRLFTVTRRDGIIVRIAEAQTAVTIAPHTWSPIGRTRLGNIRQTLGGSVPSTTLKAALQSGGPFDPADVNNGKFRDAKLQVYPVDRSAPAISLPYFTGWIGQHTFGFPQTADFEIRGHMARGKGSMMQHFQTMCRTDLGSVLCKIPILPADVARNTVYAVGAFMRVRPAGSTTPDGYGDRFFECTTAGTTHATVQPVYDYTIGNPTTDGAAVFTARDAWTRYAQISSITDGGHGIVLNRDPDARGVDGWFVHGYVRFCSGYSSADEGEEIASWDQSDRKLMVWRKMTNLIAVNDWVELHRGCDKTKATCLGVFANRKNFRGEDDIPGTAIIAAPSLAPPGGAGTTGPGIVVHRF